MRSAIAGVVGGLSGGATVLAAVAILNSHVGMEKIAGDSQAAGLPAVSPPTPVESSVPEPIATAEPLLPPAIVATVAEEPVAEDPFAAEPVAETPWVMPRSLVDTEATEGCRTDERPVPDALTVIDAPAAERVAPPPSPSSATPSDPIVAATAPSEPRLDTTIDAAEIRGTATAPDQSTPLVAQPATAVPTVGVPPAASTSQERTTAARPVREPEELRALRTFRLHVPKELPKVDPDDPERSAARTARAPREPARTPTATSTTPRAVATPSRTQGPDARATARTGTPAAAPAASSSQADSGQESLKRASEAIKRLSRRMGGGYVR